MGNAKEEFLKEIKDKHLICAKLGKEETGLILLKKGFSETDFNQFLEKIDFDYCSGYGGQELYGLILFKDSYSDRGEYDGSEWWENHKKPSVKDVEDYNVTYW